LNDFTTHLPASERVRLMDRLRKLAPNVALPTQAALHLSLEMLDAERPAPVPEVIRQTAVPDIWALTSADGRVIAFYRTGRLEEMMHDFLHQITSAGILFIAFPPDESADAEAIAAGAWLPGWQVSFVVLNEPAAARPDRRGSSILGRSRRPRRHDAHRRRGGPDLPPTSSCRQTEDRPGGGGVPRAAHASRLDARPR
jgi:hypothetical protein